MVKYCPSCGGANKIRNEYCNHCGVTLVEEPNKLIITDTLEKKRRSVIWGLLSVGIILTIISLIAIVARGRELSIMVFIMMLGWWVPIAFTVLLAYGIAYRQARKPRIFTLSDKSIEINLPNKPIFQIGWDEFNTLQIKKWSDGDLGWFDLIFTGKDYHRTFRLSRSMDFTDKTTGRIRDLLGEYAIRLKKEYIYGKKKKKDKLI